MIRHVVLLIALLQASCVQAQQDEYEAVLHRELEPTWDIQSCPGEGPQCMGALRRSWGGLIGTGVLIQPQVVVTVAHVGVEDPAVFENGDQLAHVVLVVVHPGYVRGAASDQGVDLALCFLDVPIILDEYPRICPVQGLQRFDVVILGGYSHLIRKTSKFGAFLYRGNPVEAPEILSLSTEIACIAPGDSGGPVFCDRGLVGLNRSLMVMMDTIFDNEAQRLDTHTPWIDWVIGEVMRD